jgi:hypothetical protein
MLTYYGLDWIAAVALWAHIWLLGNKSRWTWPVGLVACGAFAGVAVLTGSWGILVSEVVVTTLMVRSWLKWRKG